MVKGLRIKCPNTFEILMTQINVQPLYKRLTVQGKVTSVISLALLSLRQATISVVSSIGHPTSSATISMYCSGFFSGPLNAKTENSVPLCKMA